MRFRHKGLTEILAARKREMKWRQHYPREIKGTFNPEEDASEGKIDYYARKEDLSTDDKMEVIHQLQKKYRIVFTNKFPIDRVRWIIVPIAKLLEKVYDSYKKSYYLLRGKLIISREGYNDEILEGQRGIGLIFSGQTIKKCSLTAHNALLLQIPHSSEDLLAIQRNALLTTREKYQAIRSFKLFQHVDNLQKNYLTFINVVKYIKGDYIYKRGDISNSLYLIVQGEVCFETTIEVPQNSPCSQSLIELIRLKKKEQSHLITEVLTEGSYFGQEEIVQNCCRTQSAKCNSISCLLLVVPIDKVLKLMEIPQFRQSLQSSNNQRQIQRQRKLSSFEHLKQKTPDKRQSAEPSQHFQMFKTKMFKCLGEEKEESMKKMSLNSQKRKIRHGHSFKMARRTCETEPIQFSMLEVNEQTYSKTIKRFRHSLQQIRRQKQPNSKIEVGKARSLEKYWHVLHLSSVFDPQRLNPFIKVHNQQCNGRQNYQIYSRLMKNVKHTHSTRPKGATTSCRLKQEYIRYLQNLA